MTAKSYDVKKLPLPIHPGERVYFICEDGTVKSQTAASVGINEEGRILVICNESDYEIGPEDCVFFSAEDARRFAEDESSISEDYGIISDYRALDLPFYPETTFYYCEFNGWDRRWEIFEEFYTYVLFDVDGTVRVGDEESECKVMGKETDPCFDSLRKAKAYIRNHSL